MINRHHIANYVIGGMALALSSVGMLIHHAVSARHTWPELGADQKARIEEAVKSIPPHHIDIYCMTPECADMRDDLVETLKGARWDATATAAFGMPLPGITVSPSTPEGRKLADALQSVLGIKVKLANIGMSEWAISIGRK